MPEYRRNTKDAEWIHVRSWDEIQAKLKEVLDQGEDCSAFQVRVDNGRGDEARADKHPKTGALFVPTVDTRRSETERETPAVDKSTDADGPPSASRWNHAATSGDAAPRGAAAGNADTSQSTDATTRNAAERTRIPDARVRDAAGPDNAFVRVTPATSERREPVRTDNTALLRELREAHTGPSRDGRGRRRWPRGVGMAVGFNNGT